MVLIILYSEGFDVAVSTQGDIYEAQETIKWQLRQI